jgi:hypothetical protein
MALPKWLALIDSFDFAKTPFHCKSLFKVLLSTIPRGDPWLPFRVSNIAGPLVIPLAALKRSLFLRSLALFDRVKADLSVSEVSFFALVFTSWPPLVAELEVKG